MKFKYLMISLLLGELISAQVGVNTTLPKATLDIVAKNTDGSTVEGVLVPRVTGDALFSAIALNLYGIEQNSLVVYVTQGADLGNQTGQTSQVDAPGFYYFDAIDNQWKKMGNGSNIYNTDGTLSGTRNVMMDGHNLGFTDGRIGMGTNSPDPSAILDLTSTNDGFLPPRMTKTQMDAISGPAQGLVIYCTDCFGNLGCIMVNDSANPLIPNWGSMCSTNVHTGHIDDLQCSGATTSGIVHAGVIASGVITTIPYTGGNGGTYFSGSFNSTGVTGLIANFDGGTLANGSGNLVFNIVGTPSSAGTASFMITVAGKSCTFTVDVDSFTANVTSLDCANAVFSPSTIIQGQSYTGTMSIPYTGGNGEPYPQQSFTQNGLTFTLPAGTLLTGNGNLVYNVTGNATSAIAMSIPITFGSASCNVSKTVTTGGGSVTMCMANNTTKTWATHNLGADTSLDPNVPVKEIHGYYYQWGVKDHVADADTPPGAISGWNVVYASNGAWNSGTEDAPIKTAIDPCPAGFRVPTRTEWGELNANTTKNTIGTFTDQPTNFGSALQFICPGSGTKLTLPAAGYRYYSTGALYYRDYLGFYWSSSEYGGLSYEQYFQGGRVDQSDASYRSYGFPVRCISE
ncbi:FISUMP domain-containing protein [Chryseobacterium potabilaquae]|uniref:Fibrobacter succinogenes major paralogous domain-containing protein n=1 Tax=Chryseobacterium potabilaquae TaxID=2675057 RepID=A0A6N4X8G2_9FLAO|nr:FISUMP domain-containing protein [Chryseobacterium potabilaquae]CAA7197060.1 hypothetical protein CHRY9293_03117 [Chryseobacterium potabilaquae]